MKQLKMHSISLALGVLLAAAGWHFLTWQFWAWLIPLHLLLVLRDDAVRSNAGNNAPPKAVAVD